MIQVQLHGYASNAAWLGAAGVQVLAGAPLAIWNPATPKPNMPCVAFLPVEEDKYEVSHPGIGATILADGYAGDSQTLGAVLSWLSASLSGTATSSRSYSPAPGVHRLLYLGSLGTAGTTADIGACTVIEGEQFAGRAKGCLLPLRHGAMSDQNLCARRHTRLRSTPDGLWVEDLESTNGTFVDGLAITAPRRLRPGQELGFAGAMRYRMV